MLSTGHEEEAFELGDEQARLNPDGDDASPLPNNRLPIYVAYLGLNFLLAYCIVVLHADHISQVPY